MPSGIDKDDSWSKNYLKTESGCPYFPLTGADVFGDYMFYTTVSKQALKLRLSSEKREEQGKISYILSPLHSGSITGICTSLKRQIIATSSTDKTLRVWSYNAMSYNVQLEICEKSYDEVLSIALHPSGNYLVAANNAYIKFYNIYPKQLNSYAEVPIKTCKEMKFTTHGNLLACARANEILVIQFLTI